MAPQNKRSQCSDLQPRILSAVVMLVVAICGIVSGGVAFNILVMVVTLLLLKEFQNLSLQQPKMVRVVGFSIIIIASASILWLRSIALPANNDAGLHAIIVLVLAVCATDIAAYFVGKRFGKHPLASRISPKKTIEGLLGGMLASACITAFTGSILLSYSFSSAALLGCAIALLAQTGDLMKSWLKRQAGVKDSGHLIPGHGGVLDRLDGYLLTTPCFALMIWLENI